MPNRIIVIASTFILFCCTPTFSQSKIDPILSEKELDILQGKPTTYYSSKSDAIARELQTLVSGAIEYYELKYNKRSAISLVVLDQADWVNDVMPYGFVFQSGNWLVMNTGMPYLAFKEVYGINFSEQLLESLENRNIPTGELIMSFYKVYALHELGHYFISQISEAKSPEKWTNEMIATYFAYDYLVKSGSTQLLENFELYHKLLIDYYKPKHVTLGEFNELYTGMGVENYLWFQAQFYFLVKEIYNKEGESFLNSYEKLFPKTSTKTLSQEKIVMMLDKKTSGIVSKWVGIIENTPIKH